MIFRSKNSAVVVVGDSHSRAFSMNKNFMPFFIGPGKEMNFISDINADNVRQKVINLLQKINNKHIMFTLGEPDARYYMGKGWYPWENNVEFVLDDFRVEVDKSVDRYVTMCAMLSEKYPRKEFMVLNVTPTQRKRQNEITVYFNEQLSDKINTFLKGKVYFINVNDSILKEDLTIDEEYLGDTVHLNSRIQPLVESILINNGVLRKSYFNKSDSVSHKERMEKFHYDERFGCYVEK